MNIIKTSIKKNFLYFLIVALSSTLLMGCTKTEEEVAQYEQYVQQGDALYEQREYSEAIENYNKSIEIDDTKPEPYYGVLNILVSKNRLDDAGQIIEESAVNIPKTDRSRMYAVLGNAYFEINNWDSAETMYLKASNGVDNVPAWVGLAKVYLKNGELEKVVPYLKVTDKDTPGYYETALLKGYLAGNNKAGIKAAISGLEDVQEEDQELVVQYESLFASANKLEEDDLFNKALLAREYINAGYPYLAIDMLENSIDDMIEYSDGLYFLGRAYFEIRRYSEAIDILSSASSLGLNNSDLYLLIARSYYLTGNVDKAVEVYETSVVFATEDEVNTVVKEYSEILFEEELFTKFENQLDNMNPENIWVLFSYVDLYYVQKNDEKVRYYLDELVRTELSTSEKSEYLAREIIYNLEQEEFDEVVNILAQLKELDEYNAEYYLLLGKYEFAQNELTNAQDALELAIEYDLIGDVTTDAKKILEMI